MNFADEHYVRAYTRDTINWKMLSWEGKCTLSLLLRKLDRAGVLDLGEFAAEMSKVVATLIELPEAVVEAGLRSCLKQKSLVLNGQFIVMPNFIEAQEAVQSDRVRKAESRARHRDRTLAIARGLVTPRDSADPPAGPANGGADVTPRDGMSADESTQRDRESRNGTICPAEAERGHSSSAVPSLAEPSLAGAKLSTDSHILHELKSHPCLAEVANVQAASMLARRFATIEIARGAKLEWAIEAIREAADDSAGIGLKPEALMKKLRSYVDNARGPKPKVNGSRYSPSDAVIESPEVTPAEEEAERKKAKARIARQAEHRALLEKGEKK